MDFIEFPWISWNFYGFHGISMDFMNFHGFLGISMYFIEFPWI